MKRLVLPIFLILPFGATSGTFELADPANEILKEQQEEKKVEEEEAEEAVLVWELEQLADPMLCTVDTKTRECWCIDQVTAQRVPMSQEQCMATIIGVTR
jgi:hypothetical protein